MIMKENLENAKFKIEKEKSYPQSCYLSDIIINTLERFLSEIFMHRYFLLNYNHTVTFWSLQDVHKVHKNLSFWIISFEGVLLAPYLRFAKINQWG